MSDSKAGVRYVFRPIASGNMSRAKRHHCVPAAYLARFGEGESVLVRRRGQSEMYTPHVKNVAVESGFYEVVGVNGEPSDAVESALANVEGAAISVLTEIDRAGRLPGIGSDGRAALAMFLAAKFTRTPHKRERILFPERVATYAGSREIDAALMSEYLEKEHLGFKPEDQEVCGALDYVSIALQDRQVFTKNNVVRLAFSTVDRDERLLLGMHWSLEIARKPRLITSDAPLVLWPNAIVPRPIPRARPVERRRGAFPHQPRNAARVDTHRARPRQARRARSRPCQQRRRCSRLLWRRCRPSGMGAAASATRPARPASCRAVQQWTGVSSRAEWHHGAHGRSDAHVGSVALTQHCP
jgi:hypothetical protein